MSKITAKDVRKVAQLARLDLPDDQIATYTEQLEKILELNYLPLSQKALDNFDNK